MKKTIWILNHYALTPAQGGGTRHYNFGRELVARGYKVFIFASGQLHNGAGCVLGENEKFRIEIIDGINWVWIKTREYAGNGKNRAFGMLDYYNFMIMNYKKFSNPDVVVGSSVHLFACFAGIKIANKTGAKSISEIRDLWPQTLIDMGKLTANSFLSYILYKMESRVYKKSEKIIVTTEGMSSYLISKKVKEDKIVYINNGVDIEAFDGFLGKADKAPKSIINDFEGKFKCIYTGAIGEGNGLDNLILCAKELNRLNVRDVAIQIIGNGPEKQKLLERIETEQIENIKIYDFIKKEQISALLESADTLLFNLKRIDVLKYGLSANKLYDYMCSGKPIIFACETSTNYVQDAECGITVEAENPRALAAAIIEMFNMSTEERDVLGKNGRAFVEMNFDFKKLTDKLEKQILL